MGRALLQLMSCTSGCCMCTAAILVFAFCMIGREETSQAIPLIEADLGGDPFVAWWNMPVPQSLELQAKLQKKLTQYDMKPFLNAPYDQTSFGKASAADAPKIMYEGTTISGMFENVPEKLRGVFWMKDNRYPEELTVLQYGRWFESESIYIVPWAPFMWAYPLGIPKDAPSSEYELPNVSQWSMAEFVTNPPTFDYKFGPCPSESKYCTPGTGGDMAYAYMQAHDLGNLTSVRNLGGFIESFAKEIGIELPEGLTSGRFTLQDMDKGDGSVFKRTCEWGIGRCDCIEYGSYNLTKVIDGNGDPLQPAFDEFVAYMGDVPLLLWSGFPNADAEKTVKAALAPSSKQSSSKQSEL